MHQSVNEARKKAETEFYNADFGELEDIGDCGAEQINVTDKDDNIVWERWLHLLTRTPRKPQKRLKED